MSVAVSFLMTASGQVLAVEITKPKGVVELFTSQGCYSCPPADKLIAKFSTSNDILALSWHVDYWDYLGWKDSLASRSNTERQYSYARALKERQVYTPQAVINGRSHVVGSNEAAITTALDKYSKTNKGMIVPINASMTDSSLRISVPDTDEAKNSTLYMIFFNKKHTVKIDRGENGGKTLSYHNVVHDSQALGMIKPGGFDMDFPLSEMKRRGFDSCALLLQTTDDKGNPSVIIGATIISGI